MPSADGSREGVPAAASAVGAAYVCTRGRSPGGSQLRDSREGVPDRGFARAGATGSTRDNPVPASSRPSKAREVPGCHAQRDPPSSSFPDEARMRAASGHTVVEQCSTTVCD